MKSNRSQQIENSLYQKQSIQKNIVIVFNCRFNENKNLSPKKHDFDRWIEWTFVCLVIFTVFFQTFYFVSDLDFVKKAVGLDYKCDVHFDAIDLDIWMASRQRGRVYVWENKKSLFQYNYDDGMIGMLFGEHKHIHILEHDFWSNFLFFIIIVKWWWMNWYAVIHSIIFREFCARKTFISFSVCRNIIMKFLTNLPAIVG